MEEDAGPSLVVVLRRRWSRVYEVDGGEGGKKVVGAA